MPTMVRGDCFFALFCLNVAMSWYKNSETRREAQAVQGCQMVCFLTKNPNFGKFWRVLQWKMLVYMYNGGLVHFTVFCYISWTFGIVRGNLVYFSTFWYFVPRKIWQPWLADSRSQSYNFRIYNWTQRWRCIRQEYIYRGKNILNTH
jgi:hypothetical protein